MPYPGNPLSRHLYQQELSRRLPSDVPRETRRRIRARLGDAWFVAVLALGALLVLLAIPGWVRSRGRAE